MVTIIGVKFRCAGKIYYFDPGDQQIERGTNVIVETARGVEMGTVMLPNREVDDEKVVLPLKPVIRVATPEDVEVVREHREKEKEARRICQEKITEHQLEMKLVDVEYTFDGNKILFYFTADGRIDFRELVKDLAAIFKTRIELRQIGVRDETKILGGIGICGRCLCCSSYLSDFIPVSIKMAKEQNLSLNPTKISGVCGRLMCCLKNEEDTYEYLNRRLPAVGEKVAVTSTGEVGVVQSVNVLRQKVKVVVNESDDDVEVKEYPLDQLKFASMKREDENGEPVEEPFDLEAYIAEMQSRAEERIVSGLTVSKEESVPADREKDPESRRNRREGRGGRRQQEGAARPEGGAGEQRENRPARERGENESRGSRPARERGENESRENRPAKDRGEGERRENRPAKDRGENESRGSRPAKDRGENESRGGRPARERGEGERRENRPVKDRGENESRGSRPAKDRGRAEDRGEGNREEGMNREKNVPRENQKNGNRGREAQEGHAPEKDAQETSGERRNRFGRRRNRRRPSAQKPADGE